MPPLALPPGPSLDRATQAFLFHRDPLGFLRRQQERYGDVFTLRMALAGTIVIVADPGSIDAVIGADPERGHAGEARRRILGIASPSSVLGADGATHRTARGRLEPAFTPQAFDARRDEMAAIAERHVAAWPRGRPFRLLARIRRLSDEIFVRLVLGVRDEDRARALVRAIRGMIFSPGNPPMPIPGYEAGAVGAAALKVFERMKAPVERLLTTELDARRARRPAPGADGAGRGEGVLDVVLAGDDPPPTAQLVDELVPLLMAGQEPPSAALTWLLERIVRDARSEELFVDGAPEAEREAVVREALRLRPAVHSVARRLVAPLRAGEHELPPGVVADAPIALLHHEPRLWPDPEEFRPERWRDGRPTGPHLPFGGGARRCLGEPLAHAMIATVLPTVLRRVRLRPAWPREERPVVRATVLVPHRSMVVVASDR